MHAHKQADAWARQSGSARDGKAMSLRRRLDLLHALSDGLASSSRPCSEREAAEHLIAARNAAVWEDVWVRPERSVSG